MAVFKVRYYMRDSFDSVEANTDIKLMIHMDSEEETVYTVSVLVGGETATGLILYGLLYARARLSSRRAGSEDIRAQYMNNSPQKIGSKNHTKCYMVYL